MNGTKYGDFDKDPMAVSESSVGMDVMDIVTDLPSTATWLLNKVGKIHITELTEQD
jgi:hypothetical protein